MRGVVAEPQRHGNHAIASGEKLTFSSDAFSGSSFVPPRKLSTVIGSTSTINRGLVDVHDDHCLPTCCAEFDHVRFLDLTYHSQLALPMT